MLRQAAHLAQSGKLLRRVPGVREQVQIEHLHQCGSDKITPPGEDAGGLRPTDRLAAAERNQVSALVQEAPQIFPRRQLRRRIDQHRERMRMGDFGDLGQ